MQYKLIQFSTVLVERYLCLLLQLGVNAYAFIIMNNGHVVFHPKLNLTVCTGLCLWDRIGYKFQSTNIASGIIMQVCLICDYIQGGPKNWHSKIGTIFVHFNFIKESNNRKQRVYCLSYCLK